MSTMRKNNIFAAVLLLAGVCLAACTKDGPSDGYITDPTDLLPPSEEIHETTFSAILAARSEGKSWPLSGRLTLQYEKTDGNLELTLATIESVESDGSAKISAMLTDAMAGGKLKFVYPATLVNEAGDDIDTELLANQFGTLEDISKRFDAATGSFILQTKADELLQLEDRVTVTKFVPTMGSTPIEGILSLSVSDGTHSYTAAPVEGCFGTDGIYLAMLPVNDMELNCTATTATETYNFLSEQLTLKVGVIYDGLTIGIREPAVTPEPTPEVPPVTPEPGSEVPPVTPEPTPEVPPVTPEPNPGNTPAPNPTETPNPPVTPEPNPTETPNPPVTPEPTPETPQVITYHFTSTLSSKGQPKTKAVDENGHASWVAGESIAVYYEKDGGGYGTSTATVDDVSNGKAIISATLVDAKDGGAVKFVYPASLVNGTGDNIDESKLLNNQHGTIGDISDNFDAVIGNGTLVTDGTTCGTSGTVTMENQVLIGKFTPKFGSEAIDGITCLTISDGTNTYTVTPASGTFGTTGIYVAMLPVDAKTLSITAVTATQTYFYSSSKPITLAVGKIYTNLVVPMGHASRIGYGNVTNF